MGECVFCDIVAGKAPCHKVWEDAEHLAFLSIFPNTEGFTVVIPKRHYPSYAFELPDDVLSRLVLATKRVAGVLDAAFDDVGRTGMFFEGFGVDHVHSKLWPMHGTGDMTQWRPLTGGPAKYFDRYEGYLSSHDYERADDASLANLAQRIRATPAAMWERFVATGRAPGIPSDPPFSAWHFCDNAEQADALAQLVLTGPKRATAGALLSYEAEAEPVPTVGEYSVVTDFAGNAVCIIHTTQIDVVPFRSVGAEFASAEGEGDGSLAYWRDAHIRYFTRELAGYGHEFSEDILVVCERFELVYPISDEA